MAAAIELDCCMREFRYSSDVFEFRRPALAEPCHGVRTTVANQGTFTFEFINHVNIELTQHLSGAMLRSCQLTVTLPPNRTALSMMLATSLLASLGDRFKWEGKNNAVSMR